MSGPQRATSRDPSPETEPAVSPLPERAERVPGVVLHDLNNILMTIVMHADLLLDDVGDDNAARDRVKAIIAAVDRGSELTRQERAPVRQPAVQALSAEPEPPATPQPDAARILLAEDDPMVRKTIGRLLAEAGYAVVPAGSGNEAIRHLQTGAYSFDLVVTDMMMPDGTGRDLAEFLWATRPQTRLIFMTGYTDDPLVSDGDLRASRGWMILRKPFRPRVLLSAVADAIAEQKAKAAPEPDA